MKKLSWNVETDKFTAKTPINDSMEFENVVATLNPNAQRFMVLACHYDSKFMGDTVFVGATDSAVPCAIIMNIALKLDNLLRSCTHRNRFGLKIIFFDGEEAFVEWSESDSLYGARHLAAKWEAEDELKKIVSANGNKNYGSDETLFSPDRIYSCF